MGDDSDGFSVIEGDIEFATFRNCRRGRLPLVEFGRVSDEKCFLFGALEGGFNQFARVNNWRQVDHHAPASGVIAEEERFFADLGAYRSLAPDGVNYLTESVRSQQIEEDAGIMKKQRSNHGQLAYAKRDCATFVPGGKSSLEISSSNFSFSSRAWSRSVSRKRANWPSVMNPLS